MDPLGLEGKGIYPTLGESLIQSADELYEGVIVLHGDFRKGLVLGDYYEEIELIGNRTIEYVQQVGVQGKFEFVQNINHKNYTIRGYVTDSKKVDINTVFLS